MSTIATPAGKIYVSYRAIASIVQHAATESYGVVGLAPKNWANRFVQAVAKDAMAGVEFARDEQALRVDLYLIMEYGTRVKSVADSVAESVKYQLERTLGVTVSEVNVHVRDLRISSVD
jgi:uncharacterized alkaline shock family protein YloU